MEGLTRWVRNYKTGAYRYVKIYPSDFDEPGVDLLDFVLGVVEPIGDGKWHWEAIDPVLSYGADDNVRVNGIVDTLKEACSEVVRVRKKTRKGMNDCRKRTMGWACPKCGGSGTYRIVWKAWGPNGPPLIGHMVEAGDVHKKASPKCDVPEFIIVIGRSEKEARAIMARRKKRNEEKDE